MLTSLQKLSLTQLEAELKASTRLLPVEPGQAAQRTQSPAVLSVPVPHPGSSSVGLAADNPPTTDTILLPPFTDLLVNLQLMGTHLQEVK